MLKLAVHIKYITLLCCVLLFTKAQAQREFSEGVLTYAVTIEPPANQEGIIQYTGTYTIMLKGKQMRKELKLDNSYESTMLHTGDNVYSLKKMGKKNFAIQLNMAEMDRKQEKFKNFNLTEIKEKETIAGKTAQKGIVKYKDGTTTEISYSADWIPEPYIFERFPGIEVLPVVFRITTDEGAILHFRVKSIEPSLVENSNFKIPMDYKIISNEEYRALK